jgi:PAS domain S-box-containing protein
VHASGAAATVLINPSGTVAGWSQGAQILLGWSAEEAVSRSADELFGVGFSRALSRVLDEELNPVRLTVQAKNGTVVNAELTAHPCEDRGGRPLGAFLTVSGGAGFRQDKADTEIVKRAMEQAPFICVIFDLDLLGLWTNIVTAESGNLKRVDELCGHRLDNAPLSRAMIESVNARMRRCGAPASRHTSSSPIVCRPRNRPTRGPSDSGRSGTTTENCARLRTGAST